MYGNNCVNPCPQNCKDNICHIELGTCFACTLGWTGQSCNISKKNEVFLFGLIQVLYRNLEQQLFFFFHC